MELSLRARVGAGDPDAFGVLYDGCARAVYNHAFRLTGTGPNCHHTEPCGPASH